jgi:hypothetical protein
MLYDSRVNPLTQLIPLCNPVHPDQLSSSGMQGWTITSGFNYWQSEDYDMPDLQPFTLSLNVYIQPSSHSACMWWVNVAADWLFISSWSSWTGEVTSVPFPTGHTLLTVQGLKTVRLRNVCFSWSLTGCGLWSLSSPAVCKAACWLSEVTLSGLL